MKIIMVMVATIDAKITMWEDSRIYTWTSKEDRNYFFSLLEKNSLFVMGSNTFNAIKNNIKLQEGKLRIVLTRNPNNYSKYRVPNKLVFSSKTPKQLISQLDQEKHKQMLLLGGGGINSSFLEAQLVDEIYLTLEPKIFGLGKTLVRPIKLDVSLRLLSTEKLNKKGTILMKYKVEKLK